MRTVPCCPDCGRALEEVKQGPNSMLNAEQFDAAKCGDWFCNACPAMPGTRYRYFWNRDLTKPVPLAANSTEPEGELTDADIAGLYHATQGQTLREQDVKRVNAMARAVQAFIRRPVPSASAPPVVFQQGSLYPGRQSNLEVAIERLNTEMQSFDMVPGSMPTCGECRKPVNSCACLQTNDGPDQPDAAPDNN